MAGSDDMSRPNETSPRYRDGRLLCKARKRNGDLCRAFALRGSDICDEHLINPAARKKAMVRAELKHWGLGDSHIDPGEVLLRLVSQSANRAEFYAGLLQEQYERMDAGEEETSLPSRVRSLVGAQFALSNKGERVAIGEAVRALVQLENEERDRCSNFATKAVAAGLMERQVRLAERQGELIADVLRAVLGDARLGLSAEQQAMVPGLVRERLAIAS